MRFCKEDTMKINLVLCLFVLFAGAKAAEYHLEDNGHSLICKCSSNEDIEVYYEDGNRCTNITSLTVSSCAHANLTTYMGDNLDESLTSIKIKDIRGKIVFTPVLQAPDLKKIEIFNVGMISSIQDDYTFKSIQKLHHFHIENATIETFDQTFRGVEVGHFILKNVTILNLKVLEFSIVNNTELEIIDSRITVHLSNPIDSLFFDNFNKINIKNTIFEFPSGGNIALSGTDIHLSNNIFLNVSVNVTGKKIRVSKTCADGPNAGMRLRFHDPHGGLYNHEKSIVSTNNKLPSQITYVPHRHHGGNIVCPTANCNCIISVSNFAKTIHQKTSHALFLHFIIIASAIVARI